MCCGRHCDWFRFKACRAAVCSEPVWEEKSKAWTHATTKGSSLLNGMLSPRASNWIRTVRFYNAHRHIRLCTFNYSPLCDLFSPCSCSPQKWFTELWHQLAVQPVSPCHLFFCPPQFTEPTEHMKGDFEAHQFCTQAQIHRSISLLLNPPLTLTFYRNAASSYFLLHYVHYIDSWK